jgi:hypothetical protein
MGAANDLRDTPCLISRNGYDSGEIEFTLAKLRQPLSEREAKVLNLRDESKHQAAVTFLTIAQKKFIIRLHFRVL